MHSSCRVSVGVVGCRGEDGGLGEGGMRCAAAELMQGECGCGCRGEGGGGGGGGGVGESGMRCAARAG